MASSASREFAILARGSWRGCGLSCSFLDPLRGTGILLVSQNSPVGTFVRERESVLPSWGQGVCVSTLASYLLKSY